MPRPPKTSSAVLPLTAIALLALAALPAAALEKGIAGVAEQTIRRERPRRWAVLIGVDRYDDEYAIGSLEHCSADMKLLHKVLTGPGGGFDSKQVLLMTSDTKDASRRPTWSNILRMVPRWLRDAGPEDDVLFAFSGHGIEQGGKAYLLPSGAVKANLGLSAISLSLIQEWMDNCKAERKILIIDACHAGAGKAPAQMSAEFLKDLKRGRGFVRLASCGPRQKSNEDQKLNHGVFTYYLAKGLAGHADSNKDGRVDVAEAYKYASDNVTAWAREAGVEQDPLMEGSIQGMLTLAYTREGAWDLPPIDTGAKPLFSAEGWAEPPDTIVLQDGKEIRGHVQRKDSRMMIVRTDSGRLQRLSSSAVAKVEKPLMTLTLKDGSEVEGQLTARMGKKLMLRLADGGTRILDAAAVTRTRVLAPESSKPSGGDKPAAGDAARLGVKCAVSVDLGAGLNLDPVRQALERKFGRVEELPNGLFIAQLGSGGDPAWVFADGTVLVGSRRELSGDQTLARIQSGWLAVTREVASVTASVAADTLDPRFQQKCEFFTPGADQYQRLTILSERRYELDAVLAWPDARQSWARLVASCPDEFYYNTHITLDGQRRSLDDQTVANFSLSRIPFGEHTIAAYVNWRRGLSSFVIEAFFRTPNGRISLRDKANRPVTTREVFSRDLDALNGLIEKKKTGP
jgi:hypothetical protein